MSFTLSTFKSAVAQGSRPNNFSVSFATPSGITSPSLPTNWNILCKAAAIPAMTIGVVEIPIQGGRRIKVPGDRTFAEWTATFIADETHRIRKYFESWVALIHTNDFDSTRRSSALPVVGSSATPGYKANVTIQQLDVVGTNVSNAKYVLVDAYPSDVSAIDVSYDTTDAIEEFTVTFQYSYFNYGTIEN